MGRKMFWTKDGKAQSLGKSLIKLRASKGGDK
jgi:hypothetical protein